MTTLTFTDGVSFDTSGPLRAEQRVDGWYVVGGGTLSPAASKEAALAEIERSLVRANNNGSNDTALYELRKELDPLRKVARKERERLTEIARGNVERHLGDVCDGDSDSPDSIYDEVYTLAFDALHDAGVPDDTARSIATELGQSYANP